MPQQNTLFPLPPPRLKPATVRRLQRMLDDADLASAVCTISIGVNVEDDDGGKPEKYTARFETPVNFLAALLAPPDVVINMRPFPPPVEELPAVAEGEPTPLERLAALAERKADAASDGHLTLLHTPTGWRVLLGAPWTEDGEALIADLTEYPTLKEALLALMNA